MSPIVKSKLPASRFWFARRDQSVVTFGYGRLPRPETSYRLHLPAGHSCVTLCLRVRRPRQDAHATRANTSRRTASAAPGHPAGNAGLPVRPIHPRLPSPGARRLQHDRAAFGAANLCLRRRHHSALHRRAENCAASGSAAAADAHTTRISRAPQQLLLTLQSATRPLNSPHN